jgi:hypothetical protein
VIGLTTTYPALSHCDVLVTDLRAIRADAPGDGWAIRLTATGPSA